MRRFLLALSILIPLLAGSQPVMAQQATVETAVVHAAFFWMEGCPYCEVVMQTVLPEVQALYGNQLAVQMIEVSTTEEVDRLYNIGAALGLAKEATGVPMIIIEEQVLVGSVQIPTRLQGLIQAALEKGGTAPPDLDRLAAASPAGAEAAPVENDGMLIAWAVLLGMIVVVIFAGIVLGMALSGKKILRTPDRLELALPILGIIGMGVALYMLYVEATHAQAVCGPVGDCNAVQNSKYAVILGFLPVGLAGVIGYLVILGAWVWGWRSRAGLGAFMPVVVFGLSAFGTLFSIYLTYLEIFVIDAVCMWCISSAVVMTLIFLISLPKAAAWLAVSEEEEEPSLP
ncbi:MAG: hypothetical protein MUC85_02795 [Anaerolineales bacterium]|jgi:uncharacterized membrane protein|nr:hypothetical protein [Anaerolineales bacterium]